jgi:hypothetical protein
MTANLPHAKPEVAASADASKQFRRLKANELVRRDDFVMDDQRGFEPWQGLTGFRANAFVKPIYRRQARRPTKGRKLP